MSVEINSHWMEWRAAVERTGYTTALQKASKVLQILDRMSAKEASDLLEAEAAILEEKGRL